MTIKTLDDVRGLLKDLPGLDANAAAAAAEREPQLTKPQGSLGRLEEVSSWLSSWQGAHPPKLDNPQVRVFAGNHGITAQGVSAFPAEVTFQMVANFEHGGAAINQLSKAFGATLNVVPLELDNPTKDFSQEPAMSDGECASAILAGMDAVDEKADVLCLGEMGIGNTTPAAAIAHALYGETAAFWTGPGTGVEGAALTNKADVIERSVALHKAAMTDGLEVLRCVGGRELAAIAGAVIGARMKRVPVLLDGYICSASVAPLMMMNSTSLDHCMVAHVSAEPGHIKLLDKLGQKALLDLGMRLGEGSGAALALGLIKGAVACHAGMATFAEAGVSEKDE
ncbi:MAG: nicotinate-nucleotide--dimethylbenzimidazole phosphoribosyltransferase [Rhodospirillales bacterium]|nr:nicotinate-nucleotide--dimethylbenzimidazole phosphoribosyltransferase [Rhodospirillales bacterium]